MELKSEPKMNESAKSKVFNGVTISFAGLTEESQYELIKLLLEMGGDCRLKVDENVNYLIAEIIDNKSENYIAARRLKIPVVIPRWIQDAYSNTNSIVDFLTEESRENYRTPIFSGCEITISGFAGTERIEIGRLIEMNGGIFIGQMFKSSCTYLITANDSGEKFCRAKEWKTIYIVTVEWLRKSIEHICHMELKAEPESNESDKSKPFSGITISFSGLPKEQQEITISGFAGTERIEIGRLVEMNGGVFSGQMNRSSCTHLITANNSGEKFRRAKKWKNIYIVNFEWLKKSVEQVENAPPVESLHTEEIFESTKNKPIESTGNDFEQIHKAVDTSTVEKLYNLKVIEPTTQNEHIEEINNDDMIHNKELEAEPKMNESVKSKAFCGVTISFTGLSRESQDELTKLLLEMGGDCRLEVDEHVNYLIAEVCDNKSENYIAARRLKIPVLIPRWVQDAHSSTDSMVDFLSEESIDNYRTPIFSGCEITISGFTSNERVGMGRLIELHGGKFSGQMNKSSCTHLITANNSGEKFRRAKEWKNIYIVNDKWLRKSIEYKVRLNELRFPVDGDK
uniref:BRCT domain-containing protein n=1 Tax=Meloidogyne incognita TaxID=6306 RepID=A0A914LZ03_MELIC